MKLIFHFVVQKEKWLQNVATFIRTLTDLGFKYSQTCVKQPHKGSTKSGCWRQVAGEYQYKINAWKHFVWLLKTGWLLKIEVTANTGLTNQHSINRRTPTFP